MAIRSYQRWREHSLYLGMHHSYYTLVNYQTCYYSSLPQKTVALYYTQWKAHGLD